MKRWQILAVGAVAVLGIGYIVLHRQPFGLPGPHPIPADNDQPSSTRNPNIHPAAIEWQKLDRSAEGFKIEMPADLKQIRIPAYTETGGVQQLDMIFSNPDPQTSFSISWQDDPPVARVSKLAADRILDAARDGAIARTQTMLVSETPSNIQGFPGRTFEARNTGGGVMNARLVYAGSRLYLLLATFPSVSARRDRDVMRFFNSFAVVPSAGKSTPDAAKTN